ncbi:hypothetical protein OFD18_36210, partial [Escherichia coli]|nr:hypothetical protein [Escherichia coli]
MGLSLSRWLVEACPKIDTRRISRVEHSAREEGGVYVRSLTFRLVLASLSMQKGAVMSAFAFFGALEIGLIYGLV